MGIRKIFSQCSLEFKITMLVGALGHSTIGAVYVHAHQSGQRHAQIRHEIHRQYIESLSKEKELYPTKYHKQGE